MTEEQEDILRAIAVVGTLYGLRRNRINPVGDEVPLGAQELSAAMGLGRRLMVLGHDPIAGFPRAHGTVADEAAMLALHTLDAAGTVLEPRFVAAGDSVLRSDDPGWRWHCISGHGQSLSDWERRPLGGALSGLAVSGHTHAIDDVADLAAALAALASGKANTDHMHAIADVDGLVDALTGKAATTHTHLRAHVSDASTAGRALMAVGTPSTVAQIARINTDGSVTLIDVPDGGSPGGGWTVSATPPPAVPATHVWDTNGDTNGIFYTLGTLLNTVAWQNPVTRGNLKCMLSDSGSATAATLSDRANNYNNYWTGGSSPWATWDLGAGSGMRVTDYSLWSGGNDSYLPRYWVIEGSNNVADWTAVAINAATWVTIDTRNNDTSLNAQNVWAHFSANGDTTTQYRFLRMRWTAYIDYAILNEAEFYGVSALSRPAALPATATGWMTDGAGHYVPYWSS